MPETSDTEPRFSLKEDFHINIDKAALGGMGLPVGQWLSEFKKAVRENASVKNGNLRY